MLKRLRLCKALSDRVVSPNEIVLVTPRKARRELLSICSEVLKLRFPLSVGLDLMTMKLL